MNHSIENWWLSTSVKTLSRNMSSTNAYLIRLQMRPRIYKPPPVTWGFFWDAIYIKASCEAALQQLRLEESPRLLWVDSVCINQRDDAEKSQQLSIIVPIFARATQVVAYLGDSTEAQRIVFSCLREISSPESPRTLLLGALEAFPMAQRAAHDRALYFMRGFSNKNRYFHRIWPALEFIVAQSILLQSGRDTAHWPTSGLELDNAGLPTWTSYRSKRADISETDLLPLLQLLHSNGCSDPRDRLFCLLLIVRSWDKEAISPCYELSTEEVYIGIAAYLIQKQDALKDFFSLAGQAKHRLTQLKLPSWVPDWDNLKLSEINWNYTPYIEYPLGYYSSPHSPRMHVIRCEIGCDVQSAPLQICGTSGALRIHAALHSRPALDTKATFNLSAENQHSQTLTLEANWRGAKFMGTWELPTVNSVMVQDGDKLAWLAGQFAILRPCDESTDQTHASFELIHTLGCGLKLNCMQLALPSLPPANDSGLGGDTDDNDLLEASWSDPLIDRQVFFDDPDSGNMAVFLKYRAMSHENQLRVITADSNLQSRPGSNGDRLDPNGSQTASDIHEQYISARDRLLSLALYIRLGWFDQETIFWNQFSHAREAYKAHDAMGSQFLAFNYSALDILAEHTDDQVTRERICEWGKTMSLGAALGKLALPSALPAWSPLISSLVDWTRAIERILSYLSTQGGALNTIWSSGVRHHDQELPGSNIPTQWVDQWQRYGTNGPDGHGPKCGNEVVRLLRHIIRLAKVSTCRIPDYDGIGLAEMDRVMIARAAPLGPVSNMEWAHLSGKQLHDVEGFDADMAVRLAVLPLGLELDDSEIVDIL